MRTLFIRLSVLVFLLALTVGVTGVFAQDTMEEKVVCDADLILSLYNAEYNFDYAAIHDTVMASGMDSGFDLAKFDYGQFTPLFDSMMTMMDESMSMGRLDETMMTGVVGMMSVGMEDMSTMAMEMLPEGTMAEGATMLTAGNVNGEPAECTALRDNLRQFYTALAYENAMMMAEATPAQA